MYCARVSWEGKKYEIEEAGICRPGHVIQDNGYDDSARCYYVLECSPSSVLAFK